jgi:2-dehydro-3-deoxyphosphooctonate aldolase (KDO 8-P synthase)
MILIAGPCVIESKDKLFKDAERISKYIDKFNIDYYFKASCVKDNRTSLDNFKGVGFYEGYELLHKIRQEFGFKITTDFHTPDQINMFGSMVDLIQIPAFLSMQTSLTTQACIWEIPVNMKKPQWLPPYDVCKPVEKMKDVNATAEVWVTDRGTTFGYGNNMFDPRHIRKMKQSSYADKVLMDTTHPQNHSEIYDRTYAFELAKSAIVCGADGIFAEITTTPATALCDGDSMIQIDHFFDELPKLINLWELMNA